MNLLYKKYIKLARELVGQYFTIDDCSVAYYGYRDFLDIVCVDFTVNPMPADLFADFYPKFQKIKEDFEQDVTDLDITIIPTFYPPHHIVIVMVFTNKESPYETLP